MQKLLTIILFLSITTYLGANNINKDLKLKIDHILNLENNETKIKALHTLSFKHKLKKPELSNYALQIADSIATTNEMEYWKVKTRVLALQYDLLRSDTSNYQTRHTAIKQQISTMDKPELWGELKVAEAFYYESIGDIERSIIENSKSIEYYMQANDSTNLARIYNNISVRFMKMGNSEIAMDYLLAGYEYVEQSFDDEIVFKYLNNLGVVYEAFYDYDKALEHYYEALHLAKKREKPSLIIILYNNIANVYMLQKRLDEAKPYLDKAYEAAVYIQSDWDLIYQSHSYGNYFYEVNMPDSALHYYKISIPGFIAMNDKFSLGTAYFDLGLLHKSLGKYSEAFKNFILAENTFKAINNMEAYKKTLREMSKTYAELKQFNKAYQYSNLSDNIADSILQLSGKGYIKYLNSKIKFNNEVSSIKAELLEKEKQENLNAEKQKRRSYAFMFGGILFLFIIIFIIVLYKKTRQANKILSKKNKDISKKNALVEIAHSELMEQYSFTETLLDTIPNPVFYTDKNRYILGCNKAFEEVTGLKEQDLLDVNLNELNEKAGLACDFMALFDENEINFQKKEGLLQYADSRVHDVICFQKGILRKDGKSIGSLGIIVDISDLKSVEKKLIQSENRLKETLKAKDKFFSIVAHDLKNPFGVVLGLTETLYHNLNNFNQDDISKYLNTINDSSQKIYDLLDNLLEWAKSQTNNLTVRKTIFPVNNPINQGLALFKEQIDQKQLQINLNSKEDIMVEADKNMIQTVFRNLLSNAIKYTPDGGALNIKLVPVEEKLAVSFTDTGIGMDSDKIAQLFQLDKAISTTGLNNEKGSGLGLIICQEFIKKHDSRIEVESALNEGSTFNFELPLAKI